MCDVLWLFTGRGGPRLEMRLAPRLAPLRRLSLSLGGCLLLSLLDAGDATLDPPEQGATTASSATSSEPSPSPARQQQDADSEY